MPPKRRKPKGHKHDKLRLLRLADIEQKLQDMPPRSPSIGYVLQSETGVAVQPGR